MSFAKHLCDSVFHLIGRLVGKGNGQNMLGKYVLILNQMDNMHGQHPGLARPCPGDNPQMFRIGKHCLFLVFIQTLCIH